MEGQERPRIVVAESWDRSAIWHKPGVRDSGCQSLCRLQQSLSQSTVGHIQCCIFLRLPLNSKILHIVCDLTHKHEELDG